MKIILFVAICMLNIYCSFGQKTEIIGSLNSGLFSFRGESVESVSQINVTPYTFTGYTNNPYGSKNGLSLGGSVQVQHIFKRNFLIGVGLGYEILRSKIKVNSVNGIPGIALPYITLSANGKSFLSNHFVNGYPYIGYRFNSKGHFTYDINAGIEVGYNFKSHEIGEALASTGQEYTTNVDRTSHRYDVRPRFQLSVFKNKIGFYGGYSFGLTNYMNDYVGCSSPTMCSSFAAYSRMIRFGVNYKLK